MKKAAKISLNLGGLKLGATIKGDDPKDDPKPAESVSGFGTFGTIGKKEPTVKPPEILSKPLQEQNPDVRPQRDEPVEEPEEKVEMVVEPTTDVARVMGFSGFGDSKKAKQFDMTQMFEEAKQKAADRNASNNLKLSEEGKACLQQETIIHKFERPKTTEPKPMAGPSRPGPSKPPTSASDENVEEFDSDDDDEFIGPPIPETLRNEAGMMTLLPLCHLPLGPLGL